VSASTASADASVPPSLADRIGGPLWVVLGAAVVAASWRLERMESQGVKWFGTPGLVPGLLGAAIILAGAALSWRAWRAPVPAGEGAAAATDWRRVSITLVLCLAYAAGLVGHGLPFSLATGVYLFVHISVLQWREQASAGQRRRGLVLAAAVAVGAAVLVPFVFEQLFLVRLP
jgi:hypothetical protein